MSFKDRIIHVFDGRLIIMMKIYKSGLDLARRIRETSGGANTRVYGSEGEQREAFMYSRGYFDGLDSAMRVINLANSEASSSLKDTETETIDNKNR